MDQATLDLAPGLGVDVAYAALRELIMDAELLPNSHHVEAALALRFGLSEAELHGAVLQLETDRLVTSEGRGGIWIKPLHAAEAIATMRRAAEFESCAARVAAGTTSNKIALYAMRDAIQAMDNALFRNDIFRLARADHHFHRSLLQCCTHPSVRAPGLALSEPIHRYRMLTLRLSPLPFDHDDYCLIVEAIEGGAADEAAELVLRYWERVTQAISFLLTTHNLDSINL